MQLSETKQVGAFDDERVHRRHVDAALDDGGAHQNVVLTFPKINHGLLKRCFVHLAVGHSNACFGYKLAKFARSVFNRLHSVVHPKHLAVAQQLAPDGFGCNAVVFFANVSKDGLAVGWWRLQQRQISNAHEAHFQCARDWCCSER